MKTRKNRELVLAFETLGDVNRYRIFRSLIEKKHRTVSDIAKTLGISMPLASQHLKILVLSGLLSKKKYGRKVYNFLNLDNSSVRPIIKIFPINKKVSSK